MGTDTLFPDRSTRVSFESELPTRPRRSSLIVIQGAELGQRIDLDDRDVVIGRAENSRLWINSDLVSRHHATITRVAGRYVIIDQGSTNGTYLNDARIEEPKPLDDGDTVKIGRTVLKYTESSVELQYLEHVMGLAAKDPLTGLFNKRRFDELLAADVTRSALTSEPVSLILFDIDHFKSINDTFGHPAGDSVLKQVAELSQTALGAEVRLFRVGGEEFAALVAEPLAGAVRRADGMRREIARHAFGLGEDGKRPVTVSGGVGELNRGESGEALYARADALLYRSKRGGRNVISS